MTELAQFSGKDVALEVKYPRCSTTNWIDYGMGFIPEANNAEVFVSTVAQVVRGLVLPEDQSSFSERAEVLNTKPGAEILAHVLDQSGSATGQTFRFVQPSIKLGEGGGDRGCLISTSSVLASSSQILPAYADIPPVGEEVVALSLVGHVYLKVREIVADCVVLEGESGALYPGESGTYLARTDNGEIFAHFSGIDSVENGIYYANRGWNGFFNFLASEGFELTAPYNGAEKQKSIIELLQVGNQQVVTELNGNSISSRHLAFVDDRTSMAVN